MSTIGRRGATWSNSDGLVVGFGTMKPAINGADTKNYGGVGGDWDINGNQANSQGSGRSPLLSNNNSTWGYGPTQLAMVPYQHPNTSLNIGQVII